MNLKGEQRIQLDRQNKWKHMKSQFKFIFILVLFFNVVLVTFESCSSKVMKKATIDLSSMTMDGPLFEGPNVAQGVYKVNLSELVKDIPNLKPEQIAEARFSKIKLTNADGAFDLFTDITMQVASSNYDMQKLAYLNPVPESSKDLELQIVAEQEDIEKFFKENEFTIVADINLKQDTMASLNFGAMLEVDLVINQ
ncbi:MAG: hypothetical protein MRY83_20595 [Flavobacteriales bacterium]|nr:hypothetical protein [Flavobacteriales bacterium]